MKNLIFDFGKMSTLEDIDRKVIHEINKHCSPFEVYYSINDMHEEYFINGEEDAFWKCTFIKILLAMLKTDILITEKDFSIIHDISTGGTVDSISDYRRYMEILQQIVCYFVS